MHIVTNDTYYRYAIRSKSASKCPICGSISHSLLGWTGIKHECCGVEVNEEDWMGSICRKQREQILKMSRKELGIVMGYKTSTIKHYEFVKCSKLYANKLMDYIQNEVRQ